MKSFYEFNRKSVKTCASCVYLKTFVEDNPAFEHDYCGHPLLRQSFLESNFNEPDFRGFVIGILRSDEEVCDLYDDQCTHSTERMTWDEWREKNAVNEVGG